MLYLRNDAVLIPPSTQLVTKQKTPGKMSTTAMPEDFRFQIDAIAGYFATTLLLVLLFALTSGPRPPFFEVSHCYSSSLGDLGRPLLIQSIIDSQHEAIGSAHPSAPARVWLLSVSGSGIAAFPPRQRRLLVIIVAVLVIIDAQKSSSVLVKATFIRQRDTYR